jgi:hypothetical protein
VLTVPTTMVAAIAVAPDGGWAAICGDAWEADIWDLATGMSSPSISVITGAQEARLAGIRAGAEAAAAAISPR